MGHLRFRKHKTIYMRYIIYRALSYAFAFIIGALTISYTRFNYKFDIWDWVMSIVFFVTLHLSAEYDNNKK